MKIARMIKSVQDTTTLSKQDSPLLIAGSRQACFLALLLAGACNAFADEPFLVSVHTGSCARRDLLCYRTKESDVAGAQIHLVRLSSERTDVLFTRKLSQCYAPICMDESVITTDSMGTITKFNLKGETVFSQQPAIFRLAASKFAERFNERLIVMDKTIIRPPGQDSLFELVFVDVSTDRPIVKATIKTEQVLKVVRVVDSLFACNADKSWKVELPAEVK